MQAERERRRQVKGIVRAQPVAFGEMCRLDHERLGYFDLHVSVPVELELFDEAPLLGGSQLPRALARNCDSAVAEPIDRRGTEF